MKQKSDRIYSQICNAFRLKASPIYSPIHNTLNVGANYRLETKNTRILISALVKRNIHFERQRFKYFEYEHDTTRLL